MLSKAIKRCPLCKKEITLDRRHIDIYRVRHVEKTNCKLGRITIYADTEEEAIDLWNKNKAVPTDAALTLSAKKEKEPLSVRIVKDDKDKFEEICKQLGMNKSDAINVFVKRFIREGGFPFKVDAPPEPLER